MFENRVRTVIPIPRGNFDIFTSRTPALGGPRGQRPLLLTAKNRSPRRQRPQRWPVGTGPRRLLLAEAVGDQPVWLTPRPPLPMRDRTGPDLLWRARSRPTTKRYATIVVIGRVYPSPADR
jgi:hypothetical protein